MKKHANHQPVLRRMGSQLVIGSGRIRAFTTQTKLDQRTGTGWISPVFGTGVGTAARKANCEQFEPDPDRGEYREGNTSFA